MPPVTRSMTKAIRGPRIAFTVRGPWRASSWVDKATGQHKLRFTRTKHRAFVVLVWPREEKDPAETEKEKGEKKGAEEGGKTAAKRKGAAKKTS